MLIGKINVEPDRWYSIAETCMILHCCRKTLRKYTHSCDIEASVHPTGKLRYKGAAIEKFFNQSL